MERPGRMRGGSTLRCDWLVPKAWPFEYIFVVGSIEPFCVRVGQLHTVQSLRTILIDCFYPGQITLMLRLMICPSSLLVRRPTGVSLDLP